MGADKSPGVGFDDRVTVYDVTSSPDGQFVVCAGCDGFLYGWRLEKYLANDWWSSKRDLSPPPCWRLNAHDTAALCLKFLSVGKDEVLLISGSVDCFKVWNWAKIKTEFAENGCMSGFGPAVSINSKQVCMSSVPSTPAGGTTTASVMNEINSITFDGLSGKVYSAGGDGLIHSWDAKAEFAHCGSFSGHTNYIHQLEFIKSQRQVVSVSEDGTARFWDVRSSDCARVYTPALNELKPPPAEKGVDYLSCVSLDSNENWMAFGGGSRMVFLCQVQSLTLVAAMPAYAPITSIAFTNTNTVLSVGLEPTVYEWTMQGALQQSMTSPRVSSALAIRGLDHPDGQDPTDDNESLFFMCGTSGWVDVFGGGGPEGRPLERLFDLGIRADVGVEPPRIDDIF